MMDQMIKRLLKIALVGSPNVGKSTLLNRLVNNEISCVSNKVHTTRKNILGVYTQDDTQLEFLDSPGIVTKDHYLKHRLEHSMLTNPTEAAEQCDMIAVVIDASNIREKKRLNRGIIDMLNEHKDKKSILIMNKVDMVKEKRVLLDISTRLTQGCLEGRCQIDKRELERFSAESIEDLNLQSHLPHHLKDRLLSSNSETNSKSKHKHKHVIELAKLKPSEAKSDLRWTSGMDENSDPGSTSYTNFSHVFSISALKDEGVSELRNHFLSQAEPVAMWPHGPNYITNQSMREMIHSIIRGRVMDVAKHAAPYTISYQYLRCEYDEMGSLHIYLKLKCPERYMLSIIIGERGVNISNIIDSSRGAISNLLACEVKLDLLVEHCPKHTAKTVSFKKRYPDFQEGDELEIHHKIEDSVNN